MKKFLQTFFLVFYTQYFTPFAVATDIPQFSHPKNWSNPDIAKILKTSKIIKIEPMKEVLLSKGKKIEFEGTVFLVTLENALKTVFKSLPVDDQGVAQAEVAAYQAFLVLGFPHVPPTVLREVEGVKGEKMKGSLQLYVETPIDLLVKDQYDAVLKDVSPEDQANLRVFYFVFGQWDSGPHNLLAYKDATKTYLIAIDNSGIRNHQHVLYGDLPFVRVLYSDNLETNDWDAAFPFEKAQCIEDPSSENLKATFGNKLPTAFYDSFKSYGQPFRYVLYQNSLWREYHAYDKGFIFWLIFSVMSPSLWDHYTRGVCKSEFTCS